MIRQSKNYLLASFFTVGVNFLTLPLFTAYLSPADYGLVGLFLLFGSTVANLSSFGLNTASYGLFFKLSAEHFRYLQSTVFIFLIFSFSTVGFFLIFPASGAISQHLFNDSLSPEVLKLSFLNGCLAYFYLYYGQLLVAQQRSKAFACIVVIQISLNALATFYFLAFKSMTFMGPIFGALLANATVLVITLVCNRKLFFLGLSPQSMKRALKFGWPEMPNLVVSILHGGFDKTMLVNYSGLGEVGQYEFGGKFAGILKIIMDALGKGFSPFFLKNITEKNEDSDHAIIETFYFMAFILSFFGLCISYFSEEALILLTTTEFYSAKYLVPGLVVFYLFGIMGQLSMNQLISAEKLYVLAPISVLGLALNMIMNVLLIPKYGAIGAVVATALSALMMSVLQLYFANKVTPLPFGTRRLFGLYAIVFLFMIPGYFVILMEASVLVKLAFKCVILCVFCIVGVKCNFVRASIIHQYAGFLIKRVKPD